MELPCKREYDSGEAATALKKAKTIEDKVSYDDFVWDGESDQDELPTTDLVREYQIFLERHPYYENYFHYYLDYDFDTAYLKIAHELVETIQWDTTRSDAYQTAEAIWKKHTSVDVQPALLEELVDKAVYLARSRQTAKELVPVFVALCKHEVEGEEDFVLAMKAIIEDMGLECFPFSKGLIKEVIQKHEEGDLSSILWYRYDVMKIALGNVQRRQASLGENRLKDLITKYFEAPPDSTLYEYIDYVKEKISVAKELRIL